MDLTPILRNGWYNKICQFFPLIETTFPWQLFIILCHLRQELGHFRNFIRERMHLSLVRWDLTNTTTTTPHTFPDLKLYSPSVSPEVNGPKDRTARRQGASASELPGKLLPPKTMETEPSPAPPGSEWRTLLEVMCSLLGPFLPSVLHTHGPPR